MERGKTSIQTMFLQYYTYMFGHTVKKHLHFKTNIGKKTKSIYILKSANSENLEKFQKTEKFKITVPSISLPMIHVIAILNVLQYYSFLLPPEVLSTVQKVCLISRCLLESDIHLQCIEN